MLYKTLFCHNCNLYALCKEIRNPNMRFYIRVWIPAQGGRSSFGSTAAPSGTATRSTWTPGTSLSRLGYSLEGFLGLRYPYKQVQKTRKCGAMLEASVYIFLD